MTHELINLTGPEWENENKQNAYMRGALVIREGARIFTAVTHTDSSQSILKTKKKPLLILSLGFFFFASNIPNYSRPFPVQTPHPHLCASDSSGTLTCVMWLNLSVDPLVVSAAVLWGSVWTGRHTRVAYVLSLSFRINLLWVKGKGLCVRRGLLDASFA